MNRGIWHPGDRFTIIPGRYTSNEISLERLKEVEFVSNAHSYSGKSAVHVVIKKGSAHEPGYSRNQYQVGTTIKLFKDCLIFAGDAPTDDYSIW
jgi:hypothetical protein